MKRTGLKNLPLPRFWMELGGCYPFFRNGKMKSKMKRTGLKNLPLPSFWMGLGGMLSFFQE